MFYSERLGVEWLAILKSPRALRSFTSFRMTGLRYGMTGIAHENRRYHMYFRDSIPANRIAGRGTADIVDGQALQVLRPRRHRWGA
jgi:hypothetical protein